jgi:hypothetical protein
MADFPLMHISFAVADETSRLAWDNLVRRIFAPETLYEVLASAETERLKLDRHQTLLAIGNTVIYAAAPAGPGLHSDSLIGTTLRSLAESNSWVGIAVGVANLDEARRWVRERGWTPVSYPLLDDRYFLVDRAETLGMRLEFLAGALSNDPRLRPDWDPAWWSNHHPLGLIGLQSIGVSAKSLATARAVFGEKLGWPEIATRQTDKVRCASFLVGDAIVEALEPIDDDSELADHARKIGGIWSLTFQVRSAIQAAEYFASHGLTLIGEPRSYFALDPAQTSGRRICFTDVEVSGYPKLPIPALIHKPARLG